MLHTCHCAGKTMIIPRFLYLICAALGEDCPHVGPKSAPCLPDSAASTCARESDKTNPTAVYDCWNRMSRDNASNPNTDTQYKQGSKTETQSKRVECYTEQECVWDSEYEGGPHNCYQNKETKTTVPQTVTVNVGDGCPA